MIREKLTKQLKGSRAEVQSSVSAIKEEFKQLKKKGGTNGVALRYEVSILRLICCALQDNYHKYANIYCELVEELLPCVEPFAAKPEFWLSHLSSLVYIHHSLCREESMEACQRFYALVIAQKCHLQNPTDYKSYVSIHIKHVHYFGLQMQRAATEQAREQLGLALRSLGQFCRLLQQQQQSCSELVCELNQILGKRSSSFLKILAGLPQALSQELYQPLFELISAMSGTQEQLRNQFPDYLSASLAFVQLDGYSKAQLEQPLCLQFLRSCRQLYKDLSGHNYVLQLLYYYLKLIVSRNALDLHSSYIDLAKKLRNFFEQKAVAYAQEQWFIDFLLVFLRLEKQLHQLDCKRPCFELFWQQFGGKSSADAYAAHFELLQCLITMSMNLSSSSSLAPNCSSNDASCKSLRKHCIFMLGSCALSAYSNWQPTEQATLPKASQKQLVSIIQYAMDVAKVTKCMTPKSIELQSFVWHLMNVADKVASGEQMSLLQELLPTLQQQLRPLLGAQELCQLLRRIYKASACCSDPELAAQLHCSYITSLSCPSRKYQQMSFFYRNSKHGVEKCVYELHEGSPLKNPLSCSEKRELYELDMLAVLGNKKTPALLHSLLRHSQSDYQKVLLARQLRQDTQMLQLLEELRVKLQRKKKLTRLEQLLYGHASVSKLLESLEAQKTKIPIKETTEKGLEEMLIKHNLLNMNIGSEIPLLELGTTAIGAFEAFYNQADATPLSSDEALIDWEALIDDGIVAAMALSTMGYMPQADKAWLLLLRISRLLGDRFSYLRALTHFLGRCTQHADFDMEQEVLHGQDLLDELWPQLHAPHYFKRQHTIVLLSLCYMALYYGRIERPTHAQLLLLHVEDLREEFEERVGKCDIIQLTVQMVRFRLSYQEQRQNTPLSRLPTALQQLDTLVENVRSFSCISSMDNSALILLLSDLMQDSTECTANRLSERPNLSSSLLQVLLQSGLVLRAVEVLTSWLWTNLRMECLDKALSKLRLIDHFLCIQPLSLERRISKGDLGLGLDTGHTMDAQTKHMSELMDKMLSMQLQEQAAACVEPIRKQQELAVQSSDLQNMHFASAQGGQKLQHYVDVQKANPMLRKNLQLQCVYFMVGCLHARLFYLNRQHEQLDEFYVQANKWLQQDAARRNMLGHMVLLLQMQQVNFLRYKRQYHKAIELTGSALKLASSEELQQQGVDVNYRYNLLLQLRTAQLELHPPRKTEKLRRALKFKISPEEKPPIQSKSSTKSGSSRKPAKFAIYTEKSPSPSDSGGSSTDSSNELDLNACQVVEIIDLSDEETEPAAEPVKVSISMPRPARTTRARKQPVAPIVSPLPRTASAPNRLGRALLPNETPKTTTSTRGLSRRQPAAAEAKPVPTVSGGGSSSSSTRRRRN